MYKKKEIIFVAPRYHTHRRGLVQGLVRKGYSVSFLVSETHSSEDYTELTPRVLTSSYFEPLWQLFIRTIYRKSDAALLYSAPSIREAWSIVRNKKDAIFVIRDLWTVRSITYLICNYLLNRRQIIYSLGPIYRNSISWIHKISYFIVFSILRAGWISPVLYRVNEGKLTDLKKSAPIRFVPFAIEPVLQISKISTHLKFICVGKYQTRKRLDVLIDCFGRLQEESWSLEIVGDCTTAEREEVFRKLLSRVKELGLESRIRLRANVRHEELLADMMKFQVLVLPAINEPASISQLEAMSRGLAVIIGKDNGTAHYVAHGETGLLVEDSHEALVDALRYYMQNSQIVEQHRINAYQKVCREYTPEIAALKFLEAVGEVEVVECAA